MDPPVGKLRDMVAKLLSAGFVLVDYHAESKAAEIFVRSQCRSGQGRRCRVYTWLVDRGSEAPNSLESRFGLEFRGRFWKERRRGDLSRRNSTRSHGRGGIPAKEDIVR
jgi:hypothetical protein